jgi:hypothetical protein
MLDFQKLLDGNDDHVEFGDKLGEEKVIISGSA